MAKFMQLMDNAPQQPLNPPQQIYALRFNSRQLLRTNLHSSAADFSAQSLQMNFAALNARFLMARII
jgi:hypothetical protein